MRLNRPILQRFAGFGILSFLLSFASIQTAYSQVFWFENFGTGCNTGTTVDNHQHAASGLFWSVQENTAHADSGASFFVSSGVHFSGLGNCGNIDCDFNPLGVNKTLHISRDFANDTDNGPTYDADSVADIMAITPVIDCSGEQAIVLRFSYFEGGENEDDHATLWYDDGSGVFTLLDSIDKTPAGLCGTNGQWEEDSLYLPVSANNNPNVRLGFRWESDGDGVGSAPSFAIDSIRLRSGAPVADFGPVSFTICDGACIDLVDSSLNQPNSWNWSFPGSATTSSTDQNPTGICYPTAGAYDIELAVCNANNLCDTLVIPNAVTVDACPPPVADFDILGFDDPKDTICSGTMVNFSDLSTVQAGGAPITSWQWSFPGGIITPGLDTLQNPTGVLFNTAGTWIITLTVTDETGKDSTHMDTLEVLACPPPNANFRVDNLDDTIICQTECIDFVNLSTGTWDLVEWTFQGGTPGSSGDTNASSICFNNPGTYDITLKVFNSLGNDSSVFTIPDYIQVLNCPVPRANFSSTARTICPGDRVSFTDLSSGFPSSWEWTFFGADTADSASSDQNPINVRYDTAGSYDVQLIVCDDLHDPSNPSVHPCDTLLFQNYITVDSCNIPIAIVDIEDDTICIGSCVRFLNASRYIDTADTNVTWEWVFYGIPDTVIASDSVSDSIVVNVLDTIYQFNPIRCFDSLGAYSVRLFVENVYGSDIILENDFLVVGHYPTVEAGPNQSTLAYLDDDYDYRNNTISIEAEGTGEFWEWSPRDGLDCWDCPETVANPESSIRYFVKNTNIYGCSAEDSLEVIVNHEYFAGVPNIFSPNNDDRNDILYVRGNGINGVQFQIYNRFGQKIFESFDQLVGWDGTFKNLGEEVEPGVYIYYVKLVFENGLIEELKGNVTLVR